MTKTMEMTPNVFGAVKCWITTNANAELFNTHFKAFSEAEMEVYREFVNWLDNSRMWKSDLTIAELFKVYAKIS